MARYHKIDEVSATSYSGSVGMMLFEGGHFIFIVLVPVY